MKIHDSSHFSQPSGIKVNPHSCTSSPPVTCSIHGTGSSGGLKYRTPVYNGHAAANCHVHHRFEHFSKFPSLCPITLTPATAISEKRGARAPLSHPNRGASRSRSESSGQDRQLDEAGTDAIGREPETPETWQAQAGEACEEQATVSKFLPW